MKMIKRAGLTRTGSAFGGTLIAGLGLAFFPDPAAAQAANGSAVTDSVTKVVGTAEGTPDQPVAVEHDGACACHGPAQAHRRQLPAMLR